MKKRRDEQTPHLLRIENWDVDLPTGEWDGPVPLPLFPSLERATDPEEIVRTLRELHIQFFPDKEQGEKISAWIKDNIPNEITWLFHGLEFNFIQFQKLFYALPAIHVSNEENNVKFRSERPGVFKEDWDEKLDTSRLTFLKFLDSIGCAYQFVSENEALDNGMLNIKGYDRPNIIGSPDTYPGTGNSSPMLWKYLTTTKFIDLIQNRSIWFSRPQFFNDPHEFTMDIPSQRELFQWKLDSFAREYNRAITSKQSSYILASATLVSGLNLDENGNIIKSSIPLSQLSDTLLASIRKDIRNWQESFCISCWRYSSYDSVAIWNQYADLEEGVAIVSELDGVRKTLRNFGDVRLSIVDYRDFVDESIEPMHNNPLTYKDIRFSSEEEARFYFRARLGKERGLAVPFELHDAVKQIHLPPNATKRYMRLVKGLLDVYGLDIKIVESSLSKVPNKF